MDKSKVKHSLILRIKHYSIIILFLVSIGLLIQGPSFNLSLYGDDWLSILHCYEYYYNGVRDPIHAGPLPGVFAYLSAYGAVNCSIGLQYSFFGSNYHWYYITSLILKIFAAFSIYLLLESVLKERKIKFFAVLSAVLFLVGFTGIQNTDWAVYMLVYFSTALFILGLFFKHRFLVYKKKRDLIVSMILPISAIITTPVRFFPLIFVLPVIDILIIFSKVYKLKYSIIIFSNLIFILSIFVLWALGLFGGPMKIYSYGGWGVDQFLNYVINNPFQTVKSLLHWITAIVIPDRLFQSLYIFYPVGVSIIFLFVLTVVQFWRKRDEDSLWLIIFFSVFFIFLSGMWFFSLNRLIGSSDRYLLPVFASFCLMAAMLARQYFFSSVYMIGLLFLGMLILIFIHSTAIRSEYIELLAHGRHAKFVKQFDNLIFNDIQIPVSSKKYIYLDFDDAYTQHSILFGLGMKILVLSKQYDVKNNPGIYDQKDQMFEVIKKESKGISEDDILKNVFSYQLRRETLKSTTENTRKELLEYLQNDSFDIFLKQPK